MEVSGTKAKACDGQTPDLMCDPCMEKDEENPAVSFCTVCNEYLCNGCGRAHGRTKVTKGHLLLNGDNMPKQKPMYKESMCSKHSHKPLEFYCKTHDHFCCYVCVNVGYKHCSFEYTDKLASDFEKTDEYIALEKATDDLVRRLKEIKDVSTKHKNDINTAHENFLFDLRKFRAEINNELDSLEKSALSAARIARDLDEKTVEFVASKCDSMLTNVYKLSSELEELKKYKQGMQLLIYSKRAAVSVKSYEHMVYELAKQNKVKDYEFQPNEKIRNALQSLNMLGQLKEKTADEVSQQRNSQVMRHNVSSPITHEQAAGFVGSINVRLFADQRNCWITGGTLIDDTKLALADRQNSSVNIIDIDRNTVLYGIYLPAPPRDLTCVNQYQLAVTCASHDKGSLVFLGTGKRLSKRMSIMKELEIDRTCRGIIFTNNTFVVTFRYPESSVQIIDMNGDVLKTFKTDIAGDALFSNPEYISLSTDQLTVFVSDWSNHSVTRLTLDGAVQHVYTEEHMKSPRGLAVDLNDNVYVAGWYSDNINRLSAEDNTSQIVVGKTEGVFHPCMMAYCKTRHRLYFSVEKEGDWGVYIYQLPK